MEAAKLKPVKAQHDLQAADGAQGIIGTIKGYAFGMKSRVGAMVTAVQAKVEEAIDLAKVKVDYIKVQTLSATGNARSTAYGYYQGGVAQATGAVDYVLATVNGAVAGIKALPKKVTDTVEAGRQTAISYASYAQKQVTYGYNKLRTKGVRACVVDAADVAMVTANSILASTNARANEGYKYSKNLVVGYVSGAITTASTTVAQSYKYGMDTVESTKERAKKAAEATKTKAVDLGTSVHGVVTDKKFQTAVGSAAGGAVALGTTGGAAGLAVGGGVGAAIGVIPAIFTFGLSIPIGAAIGASTGLVVGAAGGATAGAVGGGAAGYGVYEKGADIKSGAGKAAEYVKGKAYASADFVKERAMVVRTRLVGGGTGGTEGSD